MSASRDPSAYPVIVRTVPPEQGTGYAAEVPDLPGCTASGNTPAEATAAARDAIILWIEEARRTGQPVPPPSERLREVTQ
ncbi:putative RNase H-like HicB family nuclease [Azospirillum brasilense]|uniref:Putative RNase H-like HicB family nuclease n=1 Tax=Azospirillum brasilense TaxID=192 RepID=A0A560CP92_AZOBR|nr:type II toxin-antitoxin system HicB family antitoxin [Azospirillum brasilense]MBK3736329.1 type II toxin-antitoxin system HicB family antitoxin [Azospirillum brasilense]TWA86673.1 putative RNase H-like HicB family nuclease [Azospirillum brasilense]